MSSKKTRNVCSMNQDSDKASRTGCSIITRPEDTENDTRRNKRKVQRNHISSLSPRVPNILVQSPQCDLLAPIVPTAVLASNSLVFQTRHSLPNSEKPTHRQPPISQEYNSDILSREVKRKPSFSRPHITRVVTTVKFKDGRVSTEETETYSSHLSVQSLGTRPFTNPSISHMHPRSRSERSEYIHNASLDSIDKYYATRGEVTPIKGDVLGARMFV